MAQNVPTDLNKLKSNLLSSSISAERQVDSTCTSLLGARTRGNTNSLHPDKKEKISKAAIPGCT